MDFLVKSGLPEKQRTACVVVAVFEPRRLSEAGEKLDQATGGQISSIIKRGDMEGRLGQTLLLHHLNGLMCDRVLLVGCGREREFGDRQYQTVVSTVIRTLNDTGSMEAVAYLPELNVKGRSLHWKVSQFVLAAHDALYRFDRLKTKRETVRRPLRKVTLAVPSRRDLTEGEHAILEGLAIAEGVRLTKDLANLPGNICTPTYLAEQAVALADEYEQMEAEILDEAQMEELGMGALLSVAKGSEQPAKLIVLQYRGGKENDKPIVLVGKGLTFDAGGISLKPAQNMDEMKYDMCGGASVLGTLKTVAELELPLNLVGLVPAAENLPDGKANKPGDVVTSMSGQTIEILNTDAEGRLILCDALTYAERFQPDVVIDIATLTGACVVALGHEASGLFSNHSPLANDLNAAGRESGDRAWELPMFDEYQDLLKSNFADMANVGGRYAGAITAACFLSRFTKKFKWAHLDIAGTAWRSGEKKGATGRPVPLLSRYLIDRVEEMLEE